MKVFSPLDDTKSDYFSIIKDSRIFLQQGIKSICIGYNVTITKVSIHYDGPVGTREIIYLHNLVPLKESDNFVFYN